MQIDWITVAAQIVNFLVLAWLLQHFLYRPITQAMDRREQRIETRLREAQEKQDSADRQAQDFRDKQSELERRRDDLMDEARQAARELRDRLEQEAREDVKGERESWLAQLAQERDEFLSDLRARTARHIQDVCRSALADLAGAELEMQMAARFADHLAALQGEERQKIAEVAQEAGTGIVIESRFDLPPSVRSRLSKSVREVAKTQAEIAYLHPDDAPLGIRLRVGSRQVEWSMDRYLDRVEKAVEENLSRIELSGRQEAA